MAIVVAVIADDTISMIIQNRTLRGFTLPGWRLLRILALRNKTRLTISVRSVTMGIE